MRRVGLGLFLLVVACTERIATAPADTGPRPPRDAAAEVDSGSSINGQPDAAAQDASGMDAAGLDASALDATGRDASAPDAGGPACRVNRLSPCADPAEMTRRNDTWPDGTQFNDNMSVGCLTGDNLTPLDRTRSGVLCHNEAADFYQLTYVLCDTRTMNLEIRLHPKTECPAADFRVFFGTSGMTDCGTPPPNVGCETDGEDQIIRARVEPGNTVGGWYFGVKSDRDDVRVEYDLTVRLQ